MSLELLVQRKYRQNMPIDGYDDGKNGSWFWVYDKDTKRTYYFRNESEAREYMDTLCDKAWNYAIDSLMVELRLMRRD